MKVREAMATTVDCISPQDTVQHAAELMKEKDTGFIPVVEGDRLAGAVTDRDIVVRCLAEGHPDCLREPVNHVMTHDIETISPEDDLDTAAKTMARRQIRRPAAPARPRETPGLLRRTRESAPPRSCGKRRPARTRSSPAG